MEGQATSAKVYPLLYTFQDIVIGSGFIAEVCIKGRATAVEEKGDTGADVGWWFNGVEPGGLARGGQSLNEAYFAFRGALKEILVELAYRSVDFEEFQAYVERFAHEVNRPEESDWREALQAVRSGELAAPKPNMPRDTSHESDVRVSLVDTKLLKPEDNQLGDGDSLAEAA